MLVANKNSAQKAFKTVTSHDGKAVYASASNLFKHAMFGRDSLEVAEDIITFKPDLVRQILLSLASKQGEQHDNASEEEPGKIIHEYRQRTINGNSLDGTSKIIFDELSLKWGGNEYEMAYFGSVDSTPLFVRLVGHYCQLYGVNLLYETITLRSGKVKTMEEVTKDAADWIYEKLTDFPLPLLSYKRLNPRGIENQGWKDAIEFYVDSTGRLANFDKPVVSVEVQGIAYDALSVAAELFPDSAKKYLTAAKQVQQAILKYLWLPKHQFFALGLDLDEHNRPRQLDVITANPAELLNSKLFDNLRLDQKIRYVSRIVEKMCSSDFVTSGGVRSRALSDAHVVNFVDYHGSYTTWPKETYDFVKGLKRQGFERLAEQFENRLMNITAAADCFPEFLYVDESGRIFIGPESLSTDKKAHVITCTNRPEAIQAWTVSAILGILNDTTEYPVPNVYNWQYKLESNLLVRIPDMPIIHSPGELAKRYPQYHYRIDVHSIDSSFWSFLHDSVAKSGK